MYPVRGPSRRQDGPPTNGSPSTSDPIPSSTTLSTTAAPTPTIPTFTVSATPNSDRITESQSNDSNTKPVYIIAIIITIVVLLALGFAIYIIRRTRIKHRNPKYIPTTFLKKAWEKWDPQSHRYRLPDNNDQLEYTGAAGVNRGLSSRPPSSFNSAARSAVANAENNEQNGVDRNTSVRSVMTLPAYNMIPGQNEQVLGREGERGGIDVVLEFPETIDEEEAQREAEMEALYQVRLARRRDNEAREERRRLRREARERGDHVALRELQNRPRDTNTTGPTVEELRAEHDRIKKERQRAVSSVAYGDLGVARHDGTRLRANSDESERQGLLGDAAGMAAGNHYHRRERSTSSVLSIDTVNSDLPSPGFPRSRADSGTASPLRRSFGAEEIHTGNEDRAGSSPEIIDHDDIPLSSPPGYDHISLESPEIEGPHHTEPPPDYTSPVLGRGEGPTLDSGVSRSHTLDSVMSGRRTSTHNTNPDPLPTDERRLSTRSSNSTRGVGGIPQLPSLRLSSLPSIQVDPATAEEEEQPHSRGS